MRLVGFALGALWMVACGGQDSETLFTPPPTDGGTDVAIDVPGAAGKDGGGGTAGTAGTGGAAGVGGEAGRGGTGPATGGTAGTGGAAGTMGGSGGSGGASGGAGGSGGAGTGGAGGSGGSSGGSGTGGSSGGAVDSGIKDAPAVSDAIGDRDGAPTIDGPVDADSNVCMPPTPPGPSNAVIDCNSGCGPTTDAPSSACGYVCTDSSNGYAAAGPAVSDRSLIFPAVTQKNVACACSSWSFTVYTPASGTGCVRVTASAGRTVTKYSTVDAAHDCATATPTSCAALQHDNSNTQAAVVRVDGDAPAGWVRIETGPCPLACP